MNSLLLRNILFATLLGTQVSACGPRVIVSTGTTIGLKATPGDGSTRPPQVTFGYKRAETAFVPTAGAKASQTDDAYSTLAAIFFETRWFGKTELHSFVGTGLASQLVQGVTPKEGVTTQSVAPANGHSQFWNAFIQGSAGHPTSK